MSKGDSRLDSGMCRGVKQLARVMVVLGFVMLVAASPIVAQSSTNETNPCAFGPPVPGQDEGPSGLEVAMANDRSGSMATGTRMADLKDASSGFVARLNEPTEAAAVSFGPTSEQDVTVDQNLTSDLPAVEEAIHNLSVTEGGTGTYIQGGIQTATDQLLAGPVATDGARKVMIVATDADNVGDPNAAIAAAEDARAAGITIYAVGVGSQVNESLLTDITNSSDRVFIAPDSSDLETIYQEISLDVGITGGLRVETRDLFLPNATHPYAVYNVTYVERNGETETIRENVTSEASLSSSNSSVLRVDEAGTRLIATENQNTSTWVRIDAVTENRTGCTNVIVAEPSVKNLELVPGIWRINAVGGDSTMFALLIATLLAVPAARYTSAFGGLAMGELVIVVGWLGGYVGFGIAAVSVFVSLFIGLNLAANINYMGGRLGGGR